MQSIRLAIGALIVQFALAVSPAIAAACNESVSTFSQLQTAFATCNSGGGGTITITADIDTTARLLYSGSGTLTIQSDQIGQLRRIRATGTRNWGVIESSNGPLVIDSLEITGGTGSTYGINGGGVQGWRSLTVRNSYIHDNSATTGGGLGLGYATNSTPWKTFDLQYSRVESNTATAASISTSGGYYSINGYETATIIGSSFLYNQSYGYGAAIWWRVVNLQSNFSITNSTIAFNRTTSTASGGGVVAYDYGNLRVAFTTFQGNTVLNPTSGTDIYCGTNNQCTFKSVASIFANNSVTGTCSINNSTRDSTYSVSNIETSTGLSCLRNYVSGVRQASLEATNSVAPLGSMYLSSTPALNGGTTLNFAITSASSPAADIVPSSVGSLYTTTDQRGFTRPGTLWSAGSFEFGANPTLMASGLSLSFPAGSITYNQSKQLTAVTSSVPGKITFFANGKRIAGCISRSVGAFNSYTATCNWKPANRGSAVLVSQFIPNDSSVYATDSSSPIYVVVGNRTSRR